MAFIEMPSLLIYAFRLFSTSSWQKGNKLGNRKKLLWYCIVLIFALSALTWRFGTDTPQWSLYKLVKAIRAHDAEESERYVDIDRIADGLTEAIIKNLLSKQRDAYNPSWSNNQFQQTIIDSLVAERKEEMRKECRNIFSNMVENDPSEPLIILPEGMFDAIKLFNVKRDHKMAFVSYESPVYGKIGFKMLQKPDRTWKIVAFDGQSIVSAIEVAPANRIKTGSLNDVKAGKWVVEPSCCNAKEGTFECQPEQQYKWLRTLKDKHPKFMAYMKYHDPSWNISDFPKIELYHIMVEQTYAVDKSFIKTFIGPFDSKRDADAWISWAQSLGTSEYCDSYSSHEIYKYDNKWEPIDVKMNSSKPKRVSGQITDVSWGSSGYGSLTLKLDSGKEVVFGLEPNTESISFEDKGKRCMVEYMDVITKQGNKIISSDTNIIKIKVF